MKQSLLIFSLIFLSSLFSSAAIEDSVIRVNSTLQGYSPSQPWEKTSPRKRRGLGALLSGNRVLTTSQMVADHIYLELESADSSERVPAKVIAVDYDANLALLAPIGEAGFLEKMTPTSLGSPAKPDDKLTILQLENNGSSQKTEGIVRSMELLSTFVSGRYFLCYEVKASMQTEGNSFTLPAYREGKLTGLLTSYDAKDQICDILSVDILSAFLEDAENGSYDGFPSLGVGFSTTEDPYFRKWLKIPDDQGGLYVNLVIPDSSAGLAGIKKGDVLLSIGGQKIDRKGYYEHPVYGTLYWTHLVKGSRKIGEKVSAKVLRDGKIEELAMTLKRPTERLLASHLFDQAPPFLIKGGLVFQELSLPYLKAFGKDWATRAPMNLLDILSNPEDFEEDHRRIVVLTRVIPTQATIGYERMSNQVVKSVNGQPIAGLPELEKALAQVSVNGLHEIETDDIPYRIYLDQSLTDTVDQQFKASGLPSLSRTYSVE
ncbi:PDZ domain-containing protein [Akkermansiaceae bacterium]|nr:PDZ domain-containing protein [Akkermansiaceae bacterium]